jgi:hypothetical protein
MRCFRVLGRLALVATPLALSGCISNLFLACSDTSASLAGTWAIATVNGAPIPAGGLAIPGSSDRLQAGSLTFEPTSTECSGFTDDLWRERGPAVATYTLVTSSGGAQPAQAYAGSFVHEADNRQVDLSANGQTLMGSTAGNPTEITFAGNLPDLGGLTVVFRRVP